MEDSSAAAHRFWLTEQIRAAIPDGDLQTRVVVQKLRAKLEETEPDRFAEATASVIEEWMLEVLVRMLRSGRSRSVWKQRRQDAEEATSSADSAEDYLRDVLRFSPYKDGTWKPLGAMTKEETLLVAAEYAKQSKTLRIRATVLRTLAKRCGDDQVIADVTSNEEIAQLWPGLKEED